MTGTSDLMHFDRPYRHAKLYPVQQNPESSGFLKVVGSLCGGEFAGLRAGCGLWRLSFR